MLKLRSKWLFQMGNDPKHTTKCLSRPLWATKVMFWNSPTNQSHPLGFFFLFPKLASLITGYTGKT
uniref:Uncharacterized protein n=1 Tax=Fundulus heteroclitus TaxID=8078 RepID=A0A3Q2P915_FUNHE